MHYSYNQKKKKKWCNTHLYLLIYAYYPFNLIHYIENETHQGRQYIDQMAHKTNPVGYSIRWICMYISSRARIYVENIMHEPSTSNHILSQATPVILQKSGIKYITIYTYRQYTQTSNLPAWPPRNLFP